MLVSLEIHSKQTLFVVHESSATEKLTLPADWRTVRAKTNEALLQALETARTEKLRLIAVMGADQFLPVLELFKRRLRDDISLSYGVVVVAENPPEFLYHRSGFTELLEVLSTGDAQHHLDFHLLRAVRQLVRSEDRSKPGVDRRTLEQLNEIFIDLSAERNPQRLLSTILTRGMDLIGAEGGTLYMIQEIDGELYFRIKISAERGQEPKFSEQMLKVVESSVCGYVAITSRICNIPDVAKLPPLTAPQWQKSVDHTGATAPRSALTVPLKNGRNETTALLQFVNKKQDPQDPNSATCAFEVGDESLLSSFGTQAAICLENIDLYADIQRLFEGFIKASITAIEARDPSTGGHSERVAKLSVGLARATNDVTTGIYRSVKFKEEEIRELEYASLLHDFGKIGVREEVLVKAKKLHSYQLEAVKERIKICKAAAKIAFLEKQLKFGKDNRWEKEYLQRLEEIEYYWQVIVAANEPNVLKQENRVGLDRIRHEQMLLPDGSPVKVLSEEEFQALSVAKGSLTDSERLEIESHVRHTYQFLKMIPWTKDFRHLPEIAYCHHEKLDGSGYPRGLTSHEIPLQSKIMTIADIFDALTAADRWYKEAVPTARAIDILAREVAAGQLDPVLFEIFVEKKIYDVTNPKKAA
ncbi:GAF domain-containing protein [bacterium]|nr:GAF domain-containing protein [bacterium]